MAMDATSSTLGAALSIRQAQSQYDFGLKALNQSSQQQESSVATLLQGSGGGSAGGSVTETRGQNLNIVV